MTTPMLHEFQLADISIDGEQWTLVPEFSQLGPMDQCFKVEIDDSDHAWVRFGDGIHGRRSPSGSQIVATYRSGSLGNVVIQLDKSAVPSTPDIELWVVIQSRANSLSFGSFVKTPVASPEQPLTSRKCVFLCAILIVSLLVVLLLTLLLLL